MQKILWKYTIIMLSAYIGHDSFASTATVTYFIAPDFVGKGVGGKCLEVLEKEAKVRGIRHLIADISSENTVSIKFHQNHGFSIVGELKGIGNKFGRSFGIVLMQKDLNK